MTTERDYILGTHDEEVERLGLQHRIWRQHVLDCWQRAGVTIGKRILDVGAGPGYATDIMGTFFYRTMFGDLGQLPSLSLGATIATMMFLIILTGVVIYLALYHLYPAAPASSIIVN